MYEDYVLGIDIGGTSIKCGHVSPSGDIYNKTRFFTNTIYSRNDFLNLIDSIVGSAIEDGIRKVSISSLGIFDSFGTCLGDAENFPVIKGINFVEEITSRYPTVDVRVMNDGVAAALGEYWLGQGIDCNSFICITLGTGIGSAIVLNGKPLLGAHFQSGEIGYSDYKSPDHYFERHFSTIGILKEAKKRLEVIDLDGIAFIDLVQKQNAVCVQLFDEWLLALSRIISHAILLIDPEKIIIGGGISAQKDWFCDALSEKVLARLPISFQDKVAIVPAKNGNEAALLGAASVFYTNEETTS